MMGRYNARAHALAFPDPVYDALTFAFASLGLWQRPFSVASFLARRATQ